jgi:hypothetical protein
MVILRRSDRARKSSQQMCEQFSGSPAGCQIGISKIVRFFSDHWRKGKDPAPTKGPMSIQIRHGDFEFCSPLLKFGLRGVGMKIASPGVGEDFGENLKVKEGRDVRLNLPQRLKSQ